MSGVSLKPEPEECKTKCRFMLIQELLIFYRNMKTLLKINKQNFDMTSNLKKSFIFKTFACLVTLKFAYVF